MPRMQAAEGGPMIGFSLFLLCMAVATIAAVKWWEDNQ